MRFWIFAIVVMALSFVDIQADNVIGMVTSVFVFTVQDTQIQTGRVVVRFSEPSQMRAFLIHLDPADISDFKANVQIGDVAHILEEHPYREVGSSKFSLQFNDFPTIYEAHAKSISLTEADWASYIEEFMVIAENPGKMLILEDYSKVQYYDASPNLTGKVFRFEEEAFIPKDPGYSLFTYRSLDGESYLQTRRKSENSHWMPTTEEQLKNLYTVVYIGIISWGHLHREGIEICDNGGGLHYIWTKLPNKLWTKVGNRYLKLDPVYYYDMDSHNVIYEGAVPSQLY